ncbi:MAG TPA: D-2-hydroxyacid dehydrogenase [Longimicrobiales bacterium]|nr:D-2-hydroxyacid dehydrogenase [Longimicrobiales bacterium]
MSEAARVVVMALSESRPVFRMPAQVADEVRAALGGGWTLRVVDTPVAGTADGTGPPAEALAALADAEVYLGMGVPAEVLRAGPGLRWVHTGTTGVGGSLSSEMRARDVVFTNSRGVHGPPVADTALAMVFHFARGLDLAVRAQARGAWDTSAFDDARPPLRELAASTVGVIGLGSIGEEVAARARALGCRVLGLRRRPLGAPPGVELLSGDDGLRALLAESHFVVLCAPETAATRGLLDAEALGSMRADGVLVNVGRGGLVDEDALAQALAAGRLRGAGLDVFVREPLPPGHPFWRLPNVLITPHVSSYTDRFWARETELMVDNLGRWQRGAPLRNVVDKDAGY